MKRLRKFSLAVILGCMVLSTSASAAGNFFEFTFTDLLNYTYYASWTKLNGTQAYTISLDRYNGLTKNTMSASNIFGCRMKDMSIVPVVDSYHTYSNYVTNYAQAYTGNVSQGDTMKLAAKKDSASKSSSALRISGHVTP